VDIFSAADHYQHMIRLAHDLKFQSPVLVRLRDIAGEVGHGDLALAVGRERALADIAPLTGSRVEPLCSVTGFGFSVSGPSARPVQ